jgi:hypothetical protein
MGVIFNIFTGNFDFTSGTQTPNFVQLFNATGDWGTPSGGFYSLQVLATAHGKGLNTIVQVYELNSGNYDLIDTITFVNSITGNITIRTLQTPDTRFAGKIVISENN